MKLLHNSTGKWQKEIDWRKITEKHPLKSLTHTHTASVHVSS